ncbi:NAD-dependent epimerase/dehydratase family protein [Vibrio splendidus]
MERILITGSSGFIGQNFIENYQVKRAVYRGKSQSSESNTFFIENLNSETDWSDAFEGVDCIVHLAGIAHIPKATDELLESVNIKGTIRLATEAGKAGVKRFIFLSSIGVNGKRTEKLPFSCTSPPCPHDFYSDSKYRAEEAVKRISKKYDMEFVIIRPPLVYGKGANGNFDKLRKLIEFTPFLPLKLVNNRRSFISVANLNSLIFTCVAHPKAPGNTFLAAESEAVSIKEFTNAIAKGLGNEVYQLPVPVSLMRFAGKLLGKSAIVEQLVGNLQVDSSDLKKILGWTPPYTMEESMALLKESIKERE